ncbi:MAG: hypothetical protein ACRC9L_09320 [Brevinema sp.]
MGKKWILWLALFASPTVLSAVETRTISESGYQNLWLWQLSNTSLVNREGIALANESSKVFSTPSLLWTSSIIGGTMYYGAADTARIFMVENNTENTIYSNTNKTLISIIAPSQNGFVAASGPDAEFLVFSSGGALTTNIGLSNTYIWDVALRPDNGFDVLASLPAQIYTYTNGQLSETTSFPEEDHLLRGQYINTTLWILSEKALYKKEGSKITAVAAFNGTAASFVYHDNKFYVIQSVTTPPKNSSEKEQVVSSLISVTPEGLTEELLSLQGFFFTAVNADNNTVYIGGNQYGLTISYDIPSRNSHFSSLGTGKVLSIRPQGDNLMMLTADESALWTLYNRPAVKGEFISEVYDTQVTSQWGEFTASASILPGTSVQYYVQTGVIPNTDYWSDWVPVAPGSKIGAPEGRYIRYRAVLNSSQGRSPVVYGISFPYTQRNLAPKMERISAERRPGTVLVTWAASDPNRDTLSYDIFMHEIGRERVKINGEPLTATNYTFYNEQFPSGKKRITVVASDIQSNAPETALKAELTTLPITFDSEAPVIGDFKIERNVADKTAVVSFTATDGYSPIQVVSYLINGRNPKNIRPIDEIFDSLTESFRIRVPFGIYLQFQVTDTAGNTASKGIYIPQ